MRTKIFTTMLLLALLVPASAFAYNITPYNYDSVAGVEVLFAGGTADTKMIDGYASLGFSNDYFGGVNGEIIVGQSITFNFQQAQTVDSLNFVALFADGNYLDVGNEIAQVTGFSGGQSWTYTLTAGIDSAVWTGLGSVSGLEANAGLEGNGGVWEVLNPFGDAYIDSLVFTPLHNGAPMDYRNSDFGINAMNTSATPIPAAIWILGSGLMGLVGIRRRAQS